MHGKARIGAQRGQATIEFMILLPLLLAVIVLIAYGGWWSYARLAAQNFLYSNCVGVSRSRAMQPYSDRGYQAAQNTQAYWSDQAIVNTGEWDTRLGAEGCKAELVNKQAQGTKGWFFSPLVDVLGYAPYPPFMSCDGWICH